MCTCDPRQNAKVFNQPLSWDTSGVMRMDNMFYVRCSPRPAPQTAVTPTLLHALLAPRSRPTYTPAGGGSRVAPHYTPYALLATRQYANSLSAANKLLIRCAWAGNSAFPSSQRPGGYYGWPSDPCP